MASIGYWVIVGACALSYVATPLKRGKTYARTYGCAICGKKQAADSMIYSRHTGNRFCRDEAACLRRRKRNA